MAGGASIYLANLLLDHVLGSTGFAANVYVGLLTTLPTAGGVGYVEASTGGYTRITVANNATNFPAASAGLKRNAPAITWPAFSADMPQFLGAAVWDASTSGNLLYWGPFATPRTVLNGESFVIPALGGTFRGI